MYIAAVAVAIIIALYAVVRALSGATGSESSPPLSISDAEEQIETLIVAGRKIEAIKLYRKAHGSGLREAKEAVEAEERRLKLEGRA